MIGVPRIAGATSLANKTNFPKQHLLLIVALALVLGALGALLGLTPGSVEANKAPDKTIIPIAIAATPAPTIEPEPTLVPEPVITWSDFKVKSGDNLSRVFQRAGLNDAAVFHIVKKADNGSALTKIFPGQRLGFQLDAQGGLVALRYQKSALETVIYERTENGYNVETVILDPERRRTFASATIDNSLFLAGEAAGMSENTIMELANIFGGVIDFVLDPRKGDKFYVLYEELYLDGKKIDNGDILAAEFINQGQSHSAYIYADEDGNESYFSRDGISMRKAFMLAPLDFTRVSSNFNMRRLHPIYKTTRPHRGTDYAAPRGTPVFAAGDGRVIQAGYTKANGNYVVIQHGDQFTTKYLHLHKRKIRRGARVKQHQVIGTVGATGAATGSHLHYEFLVNGVHRNPRTIHKKLPKAKSLKAEELANFQEQIQPLLSQFAFLRQAKTAMTEPINSSINNSASML